MKERVDEVRRQRETASRGRDRRLMPTVSIVGYTNAGKSTLLNALVGEEVALAEDRLFATLDPTSRQVRLGDGQVAVVTDTVGFIHKLPHQLIDAFRATLEEVNRADVLVEVVDVSDPHAAEHRTTVQQVLDELGVGAKPRLVALNKADLLEPDGDPEAAPEGAAAGSAGARVAPGAVLVSALTRAGLPELRGEMAALLASLWVDVDVVVPYVEGALLAQVRERGSTEATYDESGVHIVGRVPPAVAAALRHAAGIADEPDWEEWEPGVVDDAARDEDEPDDSLPNAEGGKSQDVGRAET
jgi:GTP-binding protein HflX